MTRLVVAQADLEAGLALLGGARTPAPPLLALAGNGRGPGGHREILAGPFGPAAVRRGLRLVALGRAGEWRPEALAAACGADAALTVGEGAWSAWRGGDAGAEPVAEVRVVGPGLPVLGRPAPLAPEAVEARRWSRVAGALGAEGWQRLRACRFALVGCGRTGSVLAHTLARAGADHLVLVDSDRLELPNLDAMEGVGPAALGRGKAEALTCSLRGFRPEMGLAAVDAGVQSLAALRGLQEAEVLLCAVDDDDARRAAAVLGSVYLKPVLDVATGIPADGGPMGADVRLTVPGRACLLCGGGLARPEAPEAAVRGARPWTAERAGSLRSLNLVAAGLGLRLLEEFLAGRGDGGWAQATFGSGGEGRVETVALGPDPSCRLCALRGTGDAGLGAAMRVALRAGRPG